MSSSVEATAARLEQMQRQFDRRLEQQNGLIQQLQGKINQQDAHLNYMQDMQKLSTLTSAVDDCRSRISRMEDARLSEMLDTRFNLADAQTRDFLDWKIRVTTQLAALEKLTDSSGVENKVAVCSERIAAIEKLGLHSTMGLNVAQKDIQQLRAQVDIVSRKADAGTNVGSRSAAIETTLHEGGRSESGCIGEQIRELRARMKQIYPSSEDLTAVRGLVQDIRIWQKEEFATMLPDHTDSRSPAEPLGTNENDSFVDSHPDAHDVLHRKVDSPMQDNSTDKTKKESVEERRKARLASVPPPSKQGGRKSRKAAKTQRKQSTLIGVQISQNGQRRSGRDPKPKIQGPGMISWKQALDEKKMLRK